MYRHNGRTPVGVPHKVVGGRPRVSPRNHRFSKQPQPSCLSILEAYSLLNGYLLNAEEFQRLGILFFHFQA